MQERYVITITRQFGSLGRPIAREMAKMLDIDYYDRDIVEMAAKEMQQPVSVVSDIEESGNSLISKMRFPLGTGERSMQDRLFQIQQKIITDIVDRESCIIVGRCSDYILRNYKNCINVYIYAPFEARYHNCVNSLNMNPKEAKRMIQEVDRARLQYHKRYAKYEPEDINYKDILINSSLLGVDGTAEYLVDMVKKKFDWLF